MFTPRVVQTRVGLVAGVSIAAVAAFCAAPRSFGQAAAPGQTQTERTVTERVTTIREREEKIVELKRAGTPVKVAIFVKNRVTQIPDNRIAAFEDQMSARLSDEGFLIIRREDALNSVKDFGMAGPNRGSEVLPGAELDQALSNQTSATRLAQTLGADYVLTASLSSLDTEYNEADVAGSKIRKADTTLTVTYQLLYAVDGAGFRGDVIDVKRSFTIASPQQLPTSSLDALLRDGAKDLCKSAKRSIIERFVPAAVAVPASADVNISVRAANFEIPEITKDDKGAYVIGEKVRPQVLNVTVEVDGITVGTAPGPVPIAPGVHKVRLSREGYRDWIRTAQVRPGMALNVDMEMLPAEESRMLQRAAVFEALRSNSKLTDGQVKVLEGYATFLQQSGLRIDIRKTSTETTDVSRSSTTTVERNEKIKTEEKSGPTTRP